MTHLDPTSMAALITGGSTVMTATIGYFGTKVHKGLKTANEVKEQVSNGHDTNLRDDIDRLLEGQSKVITQQEKLLAGQAEHTAQIADLRIDVDWERRERMDLARVVHGIHLPVPRPAAEEAA